MGRKKTTKVDSRCVDLRAVEVDSSCVDLSAVEVDTRCVDLRRVEKAVAKAANEADSGKCQHTFNIRGYVDEVRKTDHRRCWPFSAETADLGDKLNYSTTSLVVPKHSYWKCEKCIRKLMDKGCGSQSHSKCSEVQIIDADSSAIAIERTSDSVVITDKNEKKNDDQRCQKDDETTAIVPKTVRRKNKDASTVKRKYSKVAIPEKASMITRGRAIVLKEAVTSLGSSEIAAVVGDTPNKDASTVKGRNSKLAIPEKASKRSSKLATNTSTEAVTALRSSEIVVVVDTTPNKDASTVKRKSTIQEQASKKTREKTKISTEAAGSSENAGVVDDTANKDASTVKRKSSNQEQASKKTREKAKFSTEAVIALVSSENAVVVDDTPNKEASTVKRKSTIQEQASKRTREAHISTEAVAALVSSENAGVVDETPNKETTKNHRNSRVSVESDDVPSESRTELQRKRTGKSRLLSELLGTTNEETLSKTASLRGRKRKPSGDEDRRPTAAIRKASENASEDNNIVSGAESRPIAESQTNDSGFDKDPIKGKQKHNRFQFLEERIQKYLHNSAQSSSVAGKKVVPCSLQTERTEKELTIAQKRKRKAVTENKTSTVITSGNNVDKGNLDKLRKLDDISKAGPTKNTAGSSSLIDKLRNTSSTQVAVSSSPPLKDIIPPVHSKGNEVAAQELLEAPRTQSNTPKKDEIEVANVLTNIQYERCLPDQEEDKQQPPTSVTKNPLLIDLNETYDHNTMENIFMPPKPHGKEVATTREVFPARQYIQEQPYNVSSGIVRSPLARRNQSRSIQFPGVVGSSQNCQWLGNVPTTMANHHQRPSPSPFPVLPARQSVVQQQQYQYREASRPVWPSSSMTPSHAPLNMPQNLNFVDNRQQVRGFEGFSSNTIDAYPSERGTVQILSYVDPRLRSNIPLEQSQNINFVERPFPPPVHHQSRVFVGPPPQPGGSSNNTAYSTRQWPYDLYSKRVTTTAPEIAIGFPVGTPSFPFQDEKIRAVNADFRFQASWNHHYQETFSRRRANNDSNVAPVHRNNHHPHHQQHHQKPPIFPRGSSSRSRSMSSDPGRFRLLGASDSMKLPLKFHVTGNAKRQKMNKPESSNAVSARQPRSYLGPYVCTVNRNPADFTVPDSTSNRYMIRGEDLQVKTIAPT